MRSEPDGSCSRHFYFAITIENYNRIQSELNYNIKGKPYKLLNT
jgi:hypothetical protein